MKRSVQIVLFAAAVLLISCLGGVAAIYRLSARVHPVEPDFVLCYGEVNSEGHIMAETARYFAEQVKKLSGGKMLVEIYPSGQLGDDARCYQAMQMGSLDLYRGNCSSLTGDEIPMATVMALPYLFDDKDHFWEVCGSELGRQILDDIRFSCGGMRGITFFDEGARHFFTTDTPITRLEDMKGLNIRMQISDIMVDTVSALGATAVPMEYVELYSALEGKRVDGAENPPISYYYNKFYQVAPYYVQTPHTYSPGVLLISEITWRKLGTDYQNVITEAAERARRYNQDEIREAEQAVYDAMQKGGVTITELEDPEAWRAAAAPVYRKYSEPYSDIIKKIKRRDY